MKDNAAGEIARLKQQPGKDMVIYGSANLVQGFTQLGLIDEYQLLVFPSVLGDGKRLWGAMDHPVNLTLMRPQAFKNGVAVLYYEPERKWTTGSIRAHPGRRDGSKGVHCPDQTRHNALLSSFCTLSCGYLSDRGDFVVCLSHEEECLAKTTLGERSWI